MNVQFSASQSVHITVPEQPVPIQHYLRQPPRLVQALVDPKRTEQLSAEVFRLKMRPLSFMTMSVQPTVDMRLWSGSDGAIFLRSVGCEIRGNEYINRRFSLDLFGRLEPCTEGDRTVLTGRADLAVDVNLPPPLWFTPRPLLETTGNGLLQSVLMTIKQRLMHQLIADYEAWANESIDRPAANSGLVFQNSPTVS
jgi:hypothetical protein